MCVMCICVLLVHKMLWEKWKVEDVIWWLDIIMIQLIVTGIYANTIQQTHWRCKYAIVWTTYTFQMIKCSFKYWGRPGFIIHVRWTGSVERREQTDGWRLIRPFWLELQTAPYTNNTGSLTAIIWCNKLHLKWVLGFPLENVYCQIHTDRKVSI